MRLIIENESSFDLPEDLLRLAADMAQEAEGLTLDCCIQLSITDDEGIREINLDQRGIDKATDVLSFPAVSYPTGMTASGAAELLRREWDPDLRAYYAGDVVVSMERARAQAEEYGHSHDRELCYLLVHGMFHLFGYDHMNEEDKAAMREKEELALAKAGLLREDSDSVLIKMARQAMEAAYVPYSHYQVGACLLCDDGRMFTGCNVENASYGLTNCAERTAIFKAVSEGAKRFTAIAIAAREMPPWPCGACRQVLSEFCGDIRVLVSWGEDEVAQSSLSALLPHSFSPSNGVQDHLGKEQHG